MKKLLLMLFFLQTIGIHAATLIDGIYYNLDSSSNTAEVRSNPDKYSGNVQIPESVTYSGITYSVTSIGNSAFKGCGLTSVTIPPSVTSIGNSAFCGCSYLASVAIPSSVTSIGNSAFYMCSRLTSIAIPPSLTNIGNNVFAGCGNLTSVTIPSSVTSIGSGAFHSCLRLTSVTIPSSVTTIEYFAFYGCSGLTSVTIPSRVKTIGYGAFSYCSSLKDCYCYAKEVPSTENDAFYNSNYNKATLHVPAASLNAYRTTSPWSNFGTIVAIEGEEEGEKEAYAVFTDDGILTFYYDNQKSKRSGTSYILNTGSTEPGWYSDKVSITKAVFDVSFADARPTTTHFWFCDQSNLRSIEEIKNLNTSNVINMRRMFWNCNGLTSLDLSSFNTSNVTDMSYMFEACKFTSLDVSSFNTSNVTNMSWMFSRCSNLKAIICSDDWSTDKVNNSTDMFLNCSSLVGGAGTRYNSNYIDKSYAHVDGGPSNPGYLTLKGGGEEDGDDLQRYLDSLVDTEDEFVNNVYRRVFLNDNWQALYVPFAVNYSSWADKFEVARIDGELNSRSDLTWLGATIVESGDLEANYPYLIRAKSKAGATLTVNVNSSAQKTSWVSFGPYSFKGNYSKLTGLKSSRYYRLQGGTLSIPYNDSEVLLPFRWYMRIAGNQAARELRLSINGEEATGIENVNNSQSSPQVYTLSGRRVAVDAKSLPKGVYIINNKKCVIK